LRPWLAVSTPAAAHNLDRQKRRLDAQNHRVHKAGRIDGVEPEPLQATEIRRLLCLLVALVSLIRSWEPRLGVSVTRYFLQRMKTKWGSCNPRAGHIRLNTDLVKKPKHLLEYVVLHEMAHLLEPTHSERFVAILDTHYPSWREARAELNELPLSAERWRG